MSRDPKGKASKRRLRGEVQSLKRLLPYMRPYVWGIVWLVVVTIVYSAADGGRVALVVPLLNHVLMRQPTAATAREQLLEAKVEKVQAELAAALAEAAKHLPPASVIDDEDLGLGPPIVDKKTPQEWRDDEIVQTIQHTKDQLDAAAKQIADPSELSFWGMMRKRVPAFLQAYLPDFGGSEKEKHRDARRVGKVLKAIAAQRLAVEKMRDDLLHDPKKQDAVGRYVAAGLTLEARKLATEASFLGLWNELLWIFVAAMLLAVVLPAFYFLMFYVSRALVTRMVVDIQNKLAEHLLTLSIRYFNEERRGELFSRLTTDLSNTHSVLMLVLSDVLIQPLRLIVLGTFACWVSWKLAIFLVVLSVVVIIPVKVWGKKIRRSARERQATLANVFESMSQMFSGIRIVKAFRREPYEMERFQRRTDEYLQTALKVVRDRTASKAFMELMNDITIPVILLAGGYVVINHMFGLDVGRFAAFLGVVVLMYMPAKVLASSYNTLQDSLPSVDRILEILDSRAEIVDLPDAVELGKLKDTIKFEDVTFGYIADKDVLKNVSFTAKVGEVTAIVGPTTAGKSTLVDLIARFYDPRSGRVTIDGIDLRNVKLASVLDKIAVVTQDPFLFNDTIRENIRYGKLDATDAEIEAAAKAARIHDDIVAMPQGYLTNVGERGAKLSGGQRQRITIARAVLKKPEILILDEAMSSLDATTERRVQEALEELEQGRTTFAIAHRLSTVQHAHRILVLYEGRLVEEGRHDELVQKGGLYASLVKDLAMGAKAGLPAQPGEAGLGSGGARNGHGHADVSDPVAPEPVAPGATSEN